jgi:hypothetical protein
MKAKLYIGILSAVLLPGFLAQAQIADSRYYGNDATGSMVNNYYNYDYYYSSRINRFHRSYSTFNFYSPVFTDAFWYDYQPYGWGTSIYNGGGYGFGSYYNYPSYYDYGWNYPYFGNSYSWGYDPLYYSWYSPVVLNINIGSWWPHNYYSSRGRDSWDYGYRSNHNNYSYYNNYSFDNYRSYSNSYRRSGTVNTTNTGNMQRRGGNQSRTEVDRNQGDKTNNGLHPGETKRNTNPSNSGGSSSSRSSSTGVRSGSSSSGSSGTTRSSSGSKSGETSSSSKTRRK